MNNLQFQAVVKQQIDSIERVLNSKAREYASDEDRLHNFKEAAHVLRTSPLEACLAFMTKHLISVVDLVKNHPPHNNTGFAPASYPTPEILNEKIGDAINYLILLKALFIDSNPHSDLPLNDEKETYRCNNCHSDFGDIDTLKNHLSCRTLGA